MIRVVFFVVSLTFSVLIHIHAKAEKNCDSLGILLYEDLGCTAIRKDGQNCPVKYECGDFPQSNNSCLFKGRNYEISETIDNDITYPSCEVGCFCGDNSGNPQFICAVLDCPDWLGSPIEPGCLRKYSLDKCCSIGTTCPSEGESLAECEVDGTKFNEGERIWPKNTCFKCICEKNWNGNFEEPFCKRRQCNVQIRNGDKLHDKCAPTYFGEETLCCPDTWVCPSSSDVITKVNKKVDSNSELTCVFGSKTLKLGEGFQRKVDHYGSEKKVQCECVLPPFLTCKEV